MFTSLWRKFRDSVIEAAFKMHIETLWKNVCRKKLYLSYHFWTLPEKLSAFCVKILGRFVRTLFYLSIGTMREDFVWEISFSCLFRTLSDSFSALYQLFSTRECQKGFVRAQEKILSKVSFSGRTLSFIILDVDLKLFGFLAETAQKGCRNWNLHAYGNAVKRCFGKNNIKSSSILDIHRKTFGSLSKSSRHCCQNAYY